MSPRTRRFAALGLGVLVWFGVPNLWADESFKPRFEFGTTFLMGSAYELVLRGETYNDPISRLTWPLSPSLALEAAVELPWASWTSTTIGLEASWPLARGTVIDEDWNVDNLVYGRSEHESDLTANWSARIEENFRWEQLRISPGFLYRWSSWQGWNGWTRYQTTTGTSRSVVSGLVLAYKQQWLIPYLGFSWTWRIDELSLTPSVRLSPYTWCFDQDDHLTASKRYTYLDSTQGGVYGQGAIEATVQAGPSWQWGIRSSAELAYGASGLTTVTYPYVGTESIDYGLASTKAGAWFYQMALSFFVRN